MGNERLHPYAIDELYSLSDRLYCAYQATLHGDTNNHVHKECIGNELASIYASLRDLIDNEKEFIDSFNESLQGDLDSNY